MSDDSSSINREVFSPVWVGRSHAGSTRRKKVPATAAFTFDLLIQRSIIQ